MLGTLRTFLQVSQEETTEGLWAARGVSGDRLSFPISSPFLSSEDMPLEQVKNEEQDGQTQSLHIDAATERERPQQVGFMWPCYPGLQLFQGPHIEGTRTSS